MSRPYTNKSKCSWLKGQKENVIENGTWYVCSIEKSCDRGLENAAAGSRQHFQAWGHSLPLFGPTRSRPIFELFINFFCKKYLSAGASGMLWTGQGMSEWVSQWVRDVCMSHQSDWIYYKKPIKFLVVKVNGLWEDLIPIQFRTGIFVLL